MQRSYGYLHKPLALEETFRGQEHRQLNGEKEQAEKMSAIQEKWETCPQMGEIRWECELSKNQETRSANT